MFAVHYTHEFTNACACCKKAAFRKNLSNPQKFIPSKLYPKLTHFAAHQFEETAIIMAFEVSKTTHIKLETKHLGIHKIKNMTRSL